MLGIPAALARTGLPEDFAPVVAFLASDDASWVIGDSSRVGGGTKR